MHKPNYLHPFWTNERTEAFWPVIKAQANGRDAIRDAYTTLPDDLRIDLATAVADGRVPMIASSAFVLPILSPEGCQAILDRSTSYQWAENVEGEEEPYRMKEAVYTAVDPEFGAMLHSVLMTGLAPWWLMLRGRLPSQLASLQLAQYSADDRAGGAFHVDRDSNYSCVISLNPDEYEGGGTDIMDGLIGEFHLPKLPQGYGLFLDGRSLIHRGAPVTMGTRKLLVAWANDNADIW